MVTLLTIVKQMSEIVFSGRKVAVHCHAGKGRTGLVVCCFMMFQY
jgi:protein-tyrosine phosphatase